MNNPSDEEIRSSIIGLGEKSIRKSYYPLLQKKLEEIEALNKNLEFLVQERTRELEESNEELVCTIENLKTTQDKLIESGKMAKLGGLVAGIAHKINAPVNIAMTASSYILHTVEELKNALQANNSLSKEALLDFLNNTKELSTIVDTNLEKTAQLIKKFQQISVEDKKDNKRMINVNNYIHGIILGFETTLQAKKIDFLVQCDENLNLVVNPEEFNLIFSNLITNSIQHGFETLEKGKISITIKIQNDSLIIIYTNDGSFISEENLPKIFDAFFSTQNNNENPGLGLNIIYNIVSNKLNGSIKCINQKDAGVKFILSLPVTISSEAQQNIYIL